MDVNQFDLLARQPSAALIERERFWGLPKRGLAFLLANAMFWQPLWAQAEGIVVATPNTTLGQAGNGVPIVNIAAPNASGLSHNQYQQYNVGSQGVILNNASGRTQSTQLGGIIVGNPNFKGQAASTILNEVTGANASQLNGYTEVAGQAARVIVANPYGVTCNGCGFINTPRVTLTTGKPVLSNGALDHFNVQNGSVTVEGAGLNADNVDQFEIITRSAKINAELHAKSLTLVTGRNDVNAQTLNPTALADDGSDAPQLAIDSSALGGMYAGAIKLVGTEKGVGVRLAGNLAASAEDIQIDASGHLSMAQASANGAVKVQAASLEAQGAIYGQSVEVQTAGALAVQQNVAARDRISLSSGGQLTNNAIVEAGVNADNSRNTNGDVVLRAQNLRNAGSVVASRDLTATVTQALDNSGHQLNAGRTLNASAGAALNNQNGTLSGNALQLDAGDLNNANGVIASQADLNATVAALNNQQGRVTAQGNLTLKASDLDNRTGGLVGATKALSLAITNGIDNRAGEISSQAGGTVKASQLTNSDAGKLLSGTVLALDIARVINQNNGLIYAGTALRLDGGQLDNSHGTLSGQTDVVVHLTGALDNGNGLISSEGALNAAASHVNNAAGKLSSAGALSVASDGDVNNQQGSISTDSGLTLSSASLDNRNSGMISGKGATAVTTGAFDNSHSGKLTSSDRLDLTAGQVTNQDQGRIAAAKALQASVTGLDQRGGQLFSNTRLTLDLNHGQLDNQNGLINAPGALLLNNLAAVNNQNGEISSASAFQFNADSLDNSAGKLLSNQALVVRVARALSNVKGVISAAVLDAKAASLDNTEGELSSRSDLDLDVAGTLINRTATLIADGDLRLQAARVDNSNGQIASQKSLSATIGALQQPGGQLIALTTLSLTGTSLDNTQAGLIGAHGAMVLNVASIDNRGGEISSQGDISLTGEQLDNSDAGRIIAQQGLALAIDQTLNRNAGVLSGSTGLTVTGTRLDNSGASLLSQHGIDVRLDGDLLNTLGLISSEGTLQVRAGTLANNGGSLSSADALTVDSTGAITNQGGRLVTDATLVLSSTRLDNTQKGLVSAKGAVSIDTGDFDNSHDGRVSSADGLQLHAAQLTNRDGGSIGADKSLRADVIGLDQQGGELFSNADLTLDLNHGQLDNRSGLINATGALLLNNLADVNNQNGEISSGQAYTFSADSLDNGNGKLLSNQALTVRVAHALANVRGMIAAASVDAAAGSLDNSAGTLTSRSDLTLNVTGLLGNQSDGLINAAQALTVKATGIDNAGGSLLGATALNLDFNGADLDNRNGLITTRSPLTLSHLRDLKNANGEISSSQSFSLSGRTLDNSSGKLISNQVLTVSADSVLNALGLISGWQGLSVSGGSLDNRNSGTLSSRNAEVNVSLAGALLNGNSGALVSQQAMSVSAASVDNQGGILSSGAGQTLTVSGLLNNGQNGLIDSGAGLLINAGNVSNAAGTINAQQDLSLAATDFDNSAGSLASNGGVTLDLLGKLINTNAKLASAGNLLLKRATQVDNQGGELTSQRAITLFTGGLDNSNRGTLAANDALLITASGALQNANDGLIYSKNANLKLQAASLANGKGTLQSQGALDLTVTGDIDSLSGKILAQGGALNVTATNVDNRGGVLASLQQAFTARITGVLKNGYDLDHKGGITQAQSLDIRALAGFNNYGGRVSAQSGDALINTGDFDNRNGGLYAKQRVSVTGNNFDNSGDNDGQIGGQQIDLSLSGALNNRLGVIESDSTLSIVAASIDNQTGKLRALGASGTTLLNVSGLLNNSNGTLETANSNLALNVGALQNVGGSILHSGTGTFGLGLNLLQNAGGNLVSNGSLSISGDSWTNTSVLQVGDLNLNIGTFNQSATGQLLTNRTFVGRGGNWNNDGLIASNGSADLQIAGTYSGAGSLTSVGDLTFVANQADLNAATSRLSGGGKGVFSVAGTLRNLGRITAGGDLTASAGAINNYGTLGGGQNVSLSTPTLLNEGGLIFAGGDLALHANALTNHAANVYGLGNVSIGGYNGVTRSASVLNISGGMESAGAFGIDADAFENRTEGGTGTGERTLTSGSMAVRCNDCKGDYYDFTIIAREIFEGADADISAASTLSVGKDFSFHGGTFLNSKSTIAASGNITIEADNLQNVGSVGGSIERTRTYATGNITDGTANRLMANVVMPYNQRDNPDFPLVPYIDDTGAIRTAIAKSATYREGGRDGNTYKRVQLTDSVTGKVVKSAFNGEVYGIAESGLSYGFETATLSQYDPNNLLALPTLITQYTLVSDVEVAKDSTGAASTGTVRNAVIQAGGKVAITASQNLTNSVIHEDYGYSAGTNQVQNTQAAAGARVVIRVNAQLPPDLAQQQIDPTALPGFSLPTGQNGLFRLSGQTSAQPGAAANDWSIGGASITTAQRDQAIPGLQSRDIRISATDDTVVGGYQLAAVDREGSAVAGSATHIQTASSSSQNIARVQGLPSSAAKPSTGKYLIETNPALTDLKQFMSSDYLLAALGYDPDTSAKRLGDGLYEQRLIQQAVTARTGQAFIDGQTSNEAMYQYLMNNAVAEKDALNLSIGVGLSSAQVASLTHDIVWLEEHEVNGEKVLVPVVYLAQADGRLGPTGALIAGSDVSLTAGQNLDNAGTLKATGNLSATAGQDLVNSGLIDAGDRLDALAINNVTNKAGGIIAGRDVAVTAVTGDVVNERTVVALDSTARGQLHKDYADSASRIEAANDLSISAGRDINNVGSALQSGRDLTLTAGRDVNIAATQVTNSQVLNSKHTSSDITQLGSTVDAGRDVAVQGGRDINVIASQVAAKGDVAMTATENLTVSSAADEEHAYSKSKKVTSQRDQVTQVSSDISAGGDVVLSAGTDLGIVASHVTAAKAVDIDAGQDVTIASAMDEKSSFYFKKKKGSFGRSSSQQKESYDSTNVASVITAGSDLTINTSSTADGGVSLDGGRDVSVIGSQLKAGHDVMVGGTGDVAILSGTEEHGSYNKKTKSGFLGLSKSGKSQLKTTASQVASDVDGGNDVVVVAGNDVRVRASNVTAANDAELHAGLINSSGDINLVAASDTAYSKSEQYSTRTGIMGTKGGISFSAAQKAGALAQSTTNVGSQVSAEQDATLNAARDINIVGSGVSAGRNITLGAGQDVNVIAGISTAQSDTWEKTKSVGVKVSADRNGFTAFAGQQAIKETANGAQQTAAASQLSAGQDLSVSAGRDILQQGSDAYAGNDIAYQAGRNIVIDAASEHSEQTASKSVSTNGISGTINHNLGNTRDALSGAGKGEDGVSKASSTLKAVDAISQFLNGPTMDGHIGNTSQSQTVTQTVDSQRGSIVQAGNDVSMVAGNDVTVRGSGLNAGRDISIGGRDVTIDVAKGAQGTDSEETQSKGGVIGGTTGGFKIGVGGSTGIATGNSSQGTSTPSALNAVRDINLVASNDLSLIGAQVQAQRDINLNAGNDLTIKAAQNDSSSQDARHNGGGSAGIAVGQQGIGVYASVDIGRGNLDREGAQQQEAHLNAGDQLNFTSGRDTTISGATLRGDSVNGDVGRNLTVSSAPNTGKVSGKEFDVSATVVVGLGGGSASGSVGYGQTTGSTKWVEQQTSITAANDVNIRTQDHTQIDGALIASDAGKLLLDTGTLGFSDIAGKDTEHAYYLNVGGSYATGGASAQQDSSQVGKGKTGEAGWSASGYKYDKDRQQIVRATVGAGNVVVRGDEQTGADSTAGLNRDVSKAYEITKDEEHRTDLYVTKSSVDAVMDVPGTLKRWEDDARNYGSAQINELLGNLNRLRAPLVTIDDVPQQAKAALGNEKALALTKKLLENGLSSSVLGTWRPEVYSSLDAVFTSFGKLQQCAGKCPEAVDSLPGTSTSTTVLDKNGNPSIQLDSTYIHNNLYQDALINVAKFSVMVPKEQIAAGMLAVQVALGPVTAAAGYLGSVVFEHTLGPTAERLVENGATKIVNVLTDQDVELVVENNEEGKQEYAKSGNDGMNGSAEVIGAKFLISGAIAAVAGMAAAGIGALWAKSGAGKTVTISPEMKADPYHPGWKEYNGSDRGVGADVVGPKGVSGSTLTRDELISGLPVGTKITPENVVDIRRLPDGRTVWLENGTDAAGLQHIYKRHEVDFINKGISRDDIPNVVMNALERGEVVGTNGSANVYRITYNGVEQNIAVGVGSNGFVVRANPVSSWKPLP
ncbi:hemagglutinin repeat-containing protein [Pseudomonas sp. MWU16-30317]|uniref:hemagglutinin repeat-containing protein n=1 Tax=Pseudomonas sp. MWU16-30317 TaxID=2878095 RepID=UPI001CFA1FFC|nr:hemagglutinin repeat-containing protein [Pseudomonas sp. MWU16-30317]